MYNSTNKTITISSSDFEFEDNKIPIITKKLTINLSDGTITTL